MGGIVKRITARLPQTQTYKIIFQHINQLGYAVEEAREPHYIRFALKPGYRPIPIPFSKVSLEINIESMNRLSEIAVSWDPTTSYVMETFLGAFIGGLLATVLELLIWKTVEGSFIIVIAIALLYIFHPPPAAKEFVEELVNVLKEAEKQQLK
ncbi:MAG: hypothetical protein ACTSYM_10185 [Candidatus Baldrarchaeia archaeon]